MSNNIVSTLHIQDYRLLIDIGCAEHEYGNLQTVSFDILIHFATLPQACSSDKLCDSYCYQKITQLISEICQSKRHKMIEYLAYSLFQAIKATLNNDDKLAIRLKKLKPPIEGLHGGAIFCCHDEGMIMTW